MWVRMSARVDVNEHVKETGREYEGEYECVSE